MAGHSNPLTPLRYPGGKSEFAPYIKNIIQLNNLQGCEYLEPFAGGAGIALDLLLNGYCKRIHINDLDLAIYHFWKSITQDSRAFLKLLQQTPITIDEWYKQKEILNTPQNHSQLQHGFAAFFLNRTNRSGILKAGVIGGKAQAGEYKLDVRFNKAKLTNRIQRIAECAHNIQVYNQDALILLQKVDEIIPSNSLIYLDPPYYIKGQGLYRNFYTHKDHVDIKLSLDNIKQNWVVSYDNCHEIKALYHNYRQDEYVLNYCAYHKKKGSEVVIYNYNLICPNKEFLVA